MIQKALLLEVKMMVIQGVPFDLPLKFIWHDRETAEQAPGRQVMVARVCRFIFAELCGRN